MSTCKWFGQPRWANTRRFPCNGQASQGWRHNPSTRAIESQLSPEGRYCLEILNGVNLAVCDGSKGQQYNVDNDRIQLYGKREWRREYTNLERRPGACGVSRR